MGHVQEQVRSWHDLTGPNLGYAMELYERFQSDPNAVDETTRTMFEQWGPPPVISGAGPDTDSQVSAGVNPGIILRAQHLVRNLREYGHLGSRVNPLLDSPPSDPLLELSTYGLSESDLAAIPVAWVWESAPSDVRTVLDAVRRLREIYMGTISFDFSHVYDGEERSWLTRTAESGAGSRTLSRDAKQTLLKRLIEVEEFEKFLHRTFVGQKRFSIEGVDMLVPMLDELIREAVSDGTKSVMIGMAHRGRLNVLAHVLGKPYTAIFSEFHTSPNKELVPSEGSMGINYGWTGDVKYHLGASRKVEDGDVVGARLILANNPSHLEFVDPVVEGYARAAQEDRSQPGTPAQDVDGSLAILVHGDAAFPGEGVVAETLNMSGLAGYQTGGTIHLIVNNQLGFTAEAEEGRSTRYASDLAKGFEIPVVHVSADDPEACINAVVMAHAYRQRYHKDFLIDLVGYRRWGHNEMDDPVTTQPQMYAKVNPHPTVRQQYSIRLSQEQTVSESTVEQLETAVHERLAQAYQAVKDGQERPDSAGLPSEFPASAPNTAIPLETLHQLTDAMLKYPDGFTVNPKLNRILERRRAAFTGDGKIDWAHAEALAFASILQDGTPIRLTGQDSERGTFGHRHLVLHDFRTGQRMSPLQRLPACKASFAIHNSPLSEAAVIGFEYGYSVQAPETLVLWEAQFGDFANAGQVLIDQFIASGRAKWAQASGLVLLLPHGYEGQGPEHSSGRLERYLQLSAENNWRVVNLSSAAQYFHILRSQAALLKLDPRPLVVMTPKSLLRNPRAASAPTELAEKRFQPVLASPHDNASAVQRLVLSSGKVTIDFAAARDEKGGAAPLAAASVEQLYPFPKEDICTLVSQFPNLREVVWLQEEPRNMGAWGFIQPQLAECLPSQVRLRYVGRPDRSSPAEGMAGAHDTMQQWLMEEALRVDSANPDAQNRGSVS